MTFAVSCKKCARRMRNFTRHLPGWSVLCHVPLLAVIGLTALSAVSCRTQRTVERATIRADTLSQGHTEYETLETVTQAVSGDSVSLAIPMEVIQSLPEDAAFTKKQGRTRVSLKRKGEAVVAEAETDSIGQTVSRYERKAHDSLRCSGTSSATESTVKEKPPNSNWAFWVLVGIVSTIGAIIVIKIAFK